MNRMDKETLQSLYPPMTEEFSARMRRMVRGLPEKKEEATMKRKYPLVLIVAAVLLLATGCTAVAAGLGVFGQLAQEKWADDRLQDLDAVSQPIGQTITTQDGYTLTIEQAFYDGARVFMSYRLAGPLSRVELGEGKTDHAWQGEDLDAIYTENWGGDTPEDRMIEEWFSQGSGRWAVHRWAALREGLFLEDGTYLECLNGSGNRFLEDGSAIGWGEWETPRFTDVLTVQAVLIRGETWYRREGDVIHTDYVPGEQTRLTFQVTQDRLIPLAGESRVEGLYTAQAAFSLNQVDLKGIVKVHGPDSWSRAIMDWDFSGDADLITDWTLYAGEERLDTPCALEGVGQEDGALVYRLTLRHGGKVENLRLVPIYEKSGEHPQEAIRLTQTQ